MTVSNDVIKMAATYLPHDPGCFLRPADGKCPCRHQRVATAAAALESAAPFIQAQALEDAADEYERMLTIGRTAYDECTVEQKADYREFVQRLGEPAWIRARAAALRGQG